jgi:hypothetical protein
MNAWKLATDVHHLDLHNKAPFTFDCRMSSGSPGSWQWWLPEKLKSTAKGWILYIILRGHSTLGAIQSSLHLTQLKPGTRIRYCRAFHQQTSIHIEMQKAREFNWEETAKSWLTEQGSSTNSTQPPTLGKPKNKTLTNLCIPTCHLSSPIETLESPLVNSFQLHIIPKWMRVNCISNTVMQSSALFNWKPSSIKQTQSKFLPSYNHLSKNLFKKAGTWELGSKLAPHTHLPTA